MKPFVFLAGRIVLEDHEWIPPCTSVPNYSCRAWGRLQNSWSPLSPEQSWRQTSVHMSKESFKWVFGGCRRAHLEEARDYSHGFLRHRRRSCGKTSFRVSFSQGWVASPHFRFGGTCLKCSWPFWGWELWGMRQPIVSGAVTHVPLPGARAQPGTLSGRWQMRLLRWVGFRWSHPFPLDSVRVSAWSFWVTWQFVSTWETRGTVRLSVFVPLLLKVSWKPCTKNADPQIKGYRETFENFRSIKEGKTKCEWTFRKA